MTSHLGAELQHPAEFLLARRCVPSPPPPHASLTMLTAALALSGSAAAAFAPPSLRAHAVRGGRVRMEEGGAPTEAPTEAPPSETPLDERIDFRTGAPYGASASPLIDTIKVGGGTLAGDVGFDPMQLSGTPEGLAWYREAEVKHARLAMLATAGWPISELVNFGGLLDENGRAPSILNGGLDNISVVYWVVVLGLGVWVESKSIDQQLFGKMRPSNYLPGMIGFDPLGADSPTMRSAEIWNGRLAMLAITGFALEEFATGVPVVAETPFFFQPITTTLGF